MVSLWVPADEVFPAILERTKADPQAFLNVHTGEPFSAWPSNSFYAQACPQLEVLEKLVFPRKKVNSAKWNVEYFNTCILDAIDIQRYQYTVLSEIERQGKRGFLSHKKLSLSD
ncbi:hypothetical protein B0H14DRAFT_2652840 [Mycena olivaceomarginata]|nr:hypothetical protein B0H14DRAFT_2652840 [Mycena olivaceomarginata]